MLRAPTVLLVLAATVAGCVAPAAPLEQASLGTSASDAALSSSTLMWNGSIAVAAAFEAPAHFQPTEDVTWPIWKSGVLLEVVEPVSDIVFEVDWTAATPTTKLEFMTHAPHKHEENGAWSEYTTGLSDAKHLCLRIPPEDLEVEQVGYWYPMVHSDAGTDVRWTLTVTYVGGLATFPEKRHGHGPEEYPSLVPSVVQAATVGTREWLPCETAASALAAAR